jgi:hypothetical protein
VKAQKRLTQNYENNQIAKHNESRNGGMEGNFSTVIGEIKRQMWPISRGRSGFMSELYARPRLSTNPHCFFLHNGNFLVIDLV